jgi:hypothetical protein
VFLTMTFGISFRGLMTVLKADQSTLQLWKQFYSVKISIKFTVCLDAMTVRFYTMHSNPTTFGVGVLLDERNQGATNRYKSLNHTRRMVARGPTISWISLDAKLPIQQQIKRDFQPNVNSSHDYLEEFGRRITHVMQLWAIAVHRTKPETRLRMIRNHILKYLVASTPPRSPMAPSKQSLPHQRAGRVLMASLVYVESFRWSSRWLMLVICVDGCGETKASATADGGEAAATSCAACGGWVVVWLLSVVGYCSMIDDRRGRHGWCLLTSRKSTWKMMDFC